MVMRAPFSQGLLWRGPCFMCGCGLCAVIALRLKICTLDDFCRARWPRIFRAHSRHGQQPISNNRQPITDGRSGRNAPIRNSRCTSHGGPPPPAPRLPTALEARRAALLARLLVRLLLPARGERPEARAELIDREAARDPELGQRRVVSLTLEQHRACGVTRVEEVRGWGRGWGWD